MMCLKVQEQWDRDQGREWSVGSGGDGGARDGGPVVFFSDRFEVLVRRTKWLGCVYVRATATSQRLSNPGR